MAFTGKNFLSSQFEKLVHKNFTVHLLRLTLIGSPIKEVIIIDYYLTVSKNIISAQFIDALAFSPVLCWDFFLFQWW